MEGKPVKPYGWRIKCYAHEDKTKWEVLPNFNINKNKNVPRSNFS